MCNVSLCICVYLWYCESGTVVSVRPWYVDVDLCGSTHVFSVVRDG